MFEYKDFNNNLNKFFTDLTTTSESILTVNNGIKGSIFAEFIKSQKELYEINHKNFQESFSKTKTSKTLRKAKEGVKNLNLDKKIYKMGQVVNQKCGHYGKILCLTSIPVGCLCVAACCSSAFILSPVLLTVGATMCLVSSKGVDIAKTIKNVATISAHFCKKTKTKLTTKYHKWFGLDGVLPIKLTSKLSIKRAVKNELSYLQDKTLQMDLNMKLYQKMLLDDKISDKEKQKYYEKLKNQALKETVNLIKREQAFDNYDPKEADILMLTNARNQVTELTKMIRTNFNITDEDIDKQLNKRSIKNLFGLLNRNGKKTQNKEQSK